MPLPDRFIASSTSWADFLDRARKLSDTEKGRAFERLTQLYLKTAPDYRTKLQDVWLLRDVPIEVRRSIRAADRFREQQDALNRLRSLGPQTANLHISSRKTAGERSDLLRQLVDHRRSLMTNARCLTEGVDVPAIDCVLFADPKQSRIDIVQAAGRALRRYPGKEYGYILLPLIVPRKMNFDDFAETTAFRQVAQTIAALSTQDERIAAEFRAINRGRIPSGRVVEIDGDVPVGVKIKLGDFAEAISTRIWDSVGRANWRRFEDARTFVRGLGLKSYTEWRAYSKSDNKPADIPTTPARAYAEAGWNGWGDWLGTGATADRLRQYRAFNRARAFVHRLGLKSLSKWRDYCQSGKRPADIPAHPDRTYARAGWAGLGDWLGTGRRRGGGWRSFKDARVFVRGRKLKSIAEWQDYCKSGRKPDDIPTSPNYVYASDGWTGYGDWLGTGRVSPGGHRSFKEARAFVRAVKLKSASEWQNYCKSGNKPADIPATPERTYAEVGWAGLGDWLGTGRRRGGGWRSFKDARVFVRGRKLKSVIEWRGYCKSGKKPADIPTKPDHVYSNDGWAGYGDWLGTGRVSPGGPPSFDGARAFARGLQIKSKTEWERYCKSGKKPADIPARPDHVYANNGWAGYGDWLRYR
jgi:hypothetical protein